MYRENGAAELEEIRGSAVSYAEKCAVHGIRDYERGRFVACHVCGESTEGRRGALCKGSWWRGCKVPVYHFHVKCDMCGHKWLMRTKEVIPDGNP